MTEIPSWKVSNTFRMVAGVTAVFIALSMNGCTSAKRPDPHEADRQPCVFAQINGDLFEFLPNYPGGERYGYYGWKTTPDATRRLLYFPYVGRKGKLTPEIITSGNSLYRKAILENCEVVFAEISKEYPVYQGALLTKELERARALIGKNIWSNNALVIKNLDLITADPKRWYPLHNIEKLLVTGVVLDQYGHASGSGSFFIKVRKATGEEGLLKFNDQYFYESDPLPAGTAEEIRRAIEQKKVRTGMTEQQATLSWGKPGQINRGAGARGAHAQWVYGKHTLYFENNILTSFQLDQ